MFICFGEKKTAANSLIHSESEVVKTRLHELSKLYNSLKEGELTIVFGLFDQ